MFHHLTLHIHRPCRDLVSSAAGIIPTVIRLYTTDDELSYAALQLHLVLVTGLNDHPSFPPLNGSIRLGDLTVQNSRSPFFSLYVFQLFVKQHWQYCSGEATASVTALRGEKSACSLSSWVVPPLSEAHSWNQLLILQKCPVLLHKGLPEVTRPLKVFTWPYSPFSV